jgi:hypothetical protein
MEPVLASQLAPIYTSVTSATSGASPQTTDEIRAHIKQTHLLQRRVPSHRLAVDVTLQAIVGRIFGYGTRNTRLVAPWRLRS